MYLWPSGIYPSNAMLIQHKKTNQCYTTWIKLRGKKKPYILISNDREKARITVYTTTTEYCLEVPDKTDRKEIKQSLLYPKNPQKLSELIEKFRKLAKYKIDSQKSVVLLYTRNGHLKGNLKNISILKTSKRVNYPAINLIKELKELNKWKNMQCSCNEDNSFRGQYSQSSLYIDVVPAKIPTAFFFSWQNWKKAILKFI